MNSHLLTLTVFLPIAGVLLCLLVPRDSAGRACRWINLLTCVAVFGATLAVWSGWAGAGATVNGGAL